MRKKEPFPWRPVLFCLVPTAFMLVYVIRFQTLEALEKAPLIFSALLAVCACIEWLCLKRAGKARGWSFWGLLLWSGLSLLYGLRQLASPIF